MGENAKYDQEKNRLDLVFPSIIEELGFIRTYGVKKYKDPENWQKIDDAKARYTAAAMRHFNAWRAGEKIDPESGHRHLSHCACNIMFLIELERRDETKYSFDASTSTPPVYNVSDTETGGLID